MPRTLIPALTAIIIIIAILSSGCTGNTVAGNNSTAPTVIPGMGTAYLAHGRVYLDGNIIAGSQVEAVSADGTYRTSNVTDNTGVYQLVLPEGKEFNITAKYQGLQHKLWPVRLTGESASYNMYMTSTPKSIIKGKGTAFGGYVGYDPSKFFTFNGIRIMAIQANASLTITNDTNSDGSYFLEIEPGVRYQLKADTMAGVHFYYHNIDVGGSVSNVTLGANETALIDFDIVLP